MSITLIIITILSTISLKYNSICRLITQNSGLQICAEIWIAYVSYAI